ncbi:MAG: aspartate kinase [Planctomycetes bacterium]|nr:aspartate kinase [Planctomycetota bacterium]
MQAANDNAGERGRNGASAGASPARPLVQKFGGTSVGDAAAMRAAAELVRAASPQPVLVVLSAMARVTDELLALARLAASGAAQPAEELRLRLMERHRVTAEELFATRVPEDLARDFEEQGAELARLLAALHGGSGKPASARQLDAIAGLGERLSTRVFARYLRHLGAAAELVDAGAVLVTDDAFGAAAPRFERIATLAREHFAPRLAPGRIVVTQGYVGRSEAGEPTTLGRGGSDYSAAIFGAALGASEIQIWTDVEGVLTADPRRVERARPIAQLSAAEAGELAAFGAKVLHPATIHPAVEAGIPVTVRHTRRPSGRFTTITKNGSSGRDVVAIASRGPIHVITASSPRMLQQAGFLARLFEVFARRRVSVDLVATAELSVSLTVEHEAPVRSLAEEIAAFAEVSVAEERAIVAVVGERLKRTRGVCTRVFDALAEMPIELISMGANEINLSVVVERKLEQDVVRRLHAALIESEGGGER